ncbi:VOC family protein [Thermoleophilum album]|uniref:VOC family protein n=1 Tax=Thermoleophilum album TaxID=29539 RepID=UPI00237CAEEE|nr:VOC family protein [Thermoleophilum album]WDT93027.1 VOC family protein [Thermoleophilum album]
MSEATASTRPTRTPTITPCLWLSERAGDVATRYAALFSDPATSPVDGPATSSAHSAAQSGDANGGDTSIRYVTPIPATPAGSSGGEVAALRLAGQPVLVMSTNNGPPATANPSISFFVRFDPALVADASERLGRLWRELANGGKVLMELGEYAYSPLYGWVEDRHGVSWQLFTPPPDAEPRPTVMVSLLFTDMDGTAASASAFYRAVFPGSQEAFTARLADVMPEARDGTLTEHGSGERVMYSDFRLGETWFVAMDGGSEHGFAFNEAISLMVECDTQDEIDHYWGALSAVPEAEICGWCRDRFGVTWQVAPSLMHDVLAEGDPARVLRHVEALQKMKKIELAGLAGA